MCEDCELVRKFTQTDGCELWGFRLPYLPPCGEGLLGVGIDHNRGAVADAFGGYGEMRGDCRFAATPLSGK